jgi:hypothetical protein
MLNKNYLTAGERRPTQTVFVNKDYRQFACKKGLFAGESPILFLEKKT